MAYIFVHVAIRCLDYHVVNLSGNEGQILEFHGKRTSGVFALNLWIDHL